MVALKSQLFRAGLSALWYSGAARACERWTAGKGGVLMLHRVQPGPAPQFAPNARLSISPGYLHALLAGFRAADIDVVSLDEALARVHSRERTRRFVCFTFDDGYRDNLEHALPVFERFRAPFTIYATTGFIDRALTPWWIALEQVIASEAAVRWGAEATAPLRSAQGTSAATPGVRPQATRSSSAEMRSSQSEKAQVDRVGGARGVLGEQQQALWSSDSRAGASVEARALCSTAAVERASSPGAGASFDYARASSLEGERSAGLRGHAGKTRGKQPGVLHFATDTCAGKQRAFAALSARFMQMTAAELPLQLERFLSDHGFGMRELAEREMCSWAELRALQDAGVEIGCHGVTHARLSRETAETVHAELSRARRLLEAKLGQPVRHLAYPYGKPEHAGPREYALARELGFASAVTTRAGCLFPAHAARRHNLPRIEVTPSFDASTHYLQTILTGLPLIARNCGRMLSTAPRKLVT